MFVPCLFVFILQAPWCGHCQQLTPIFVSSAKASEVPFGKVDCTANKQICEIYQIQGYPTLKLFYSSGKAVDFEGERDEATILAFLQKKTGPPSLLQTESEGLASFLATESNSRVVAYIEESSDNYATWKSVAQATGLDSFVFAHVASSLWGDHKEGSIDLLVGSETYSYTGAFEADSILTWIMEKGFPIVDSLSQESWTRAQKHPSSKILVAVFYDNSEEAPAYVCFFCQFYQSPFSPLFYSPFLTHSYSLLLTLTLTHTHSLTHTPL
jgi:protein disulfide-isomerase A1